MQNAAAAPVVRPSLPSALIWRNFSRIWRHGVIGLRRGARMLPHPDFDGSARHLREDYRGPFPHHALPLRLSLRVAQLCGGRRRTRCAMPARTSRSSASRACFRSFLPMCT